MYNAVADFVEVTVDGTYHVLIPSRFPPIDIFSFIANGQDEAFAEVESLTNPRMKERRDLLNGTNAVDGNSPLVQNWNHAPFAYPNPDGTRFFGPHIAALELAIDRETALVISIGKREAFLAATAEPPIGLDMRALSRPVRGRFVDLRSVDPTLPLDQRRVIGQRVAEAGYDGVIFRPGERTAAECVSVINGQTLGRAVQGEHYKFNWNGQMIDMLYDFHAGQKVLPSQLTGNPGGMAA